jgi:hypothetical protein
LVNFPGQPWTVYEPRNPTDTLKMARMVDGLLGRLCERDYIDVIIDRLFFVANGSSSEILTQLLILLGHNENMKGALYLNGLYTVSTDMKKKILDLVDSFISCDEETAPKLVDLVNNYYTE